MRVYRIALKRFGATVQAAFSGQSGFAADGRWHSRERHLDYAAESLSLATLERLVHYKRFNCLLPHVLYELEIPDAQIERLARRPRGWDGPDFLPASQALGNAWYDGARSPALLVPSSVTDGEHNLILCRRHPNWNWAWIVAGPTPFRFDARLAEALRPRRG